MPFSQSSGEQLGEVKIQKITSFGHVNQEELKNT